MVIGLYGTCLLLDNIVRARNKTDSMAGSFGRVDGRCAASGCASLGVLVFGVWLVSPPRTRSGGITE